jgi:adenine/guanine phosphoribosyltransferase-like PRPP-binding protein
MYMQHPSYEEELYNPESLVRVADRIIALITRDYPDTDGVAACGISGIAVAAVVSAISGIPLITVRKESDQCNTEIRVQGPDHDVKSYVIVDDLVSSGRTVRHIVNNLAFMSCKALFLYHDNFPDDARHTVDFPVYDVWHNR